MADRRNIPLVVSTHYHPADRSGAAHGRRGCSACRMSASGPPPIGWRRRSSWRPNWRRGWSREFAPADRIRIIPPGIDLAAWSDPVGDIPPPAVAGRAISCSSAGSLPTRGCRSWSKRWRGLPPAARLPLVLMGPGLGRTDGAGGPGPIPRPRGLGAVPGARQPRPERFRAVIRGARALVLPSEWEAFGLVLLMAMAAGTPIVATAVGGVPEVLDHGRAGLLVPYDRPGRARRRPGPPNGRTRPNSMNGSGWPANASKRSTGR